MKRDGNFRIFKKSVDEISLPERFTYPFYYDVHPLAEIAAEEELMGGAGAPAVDLLEQAAGGGADEDLLF